MSTKQKIRRPKEKEGVGNMVLESSDPCCMPGCCSSNPGNKHDEQRQVMNLSLGKLRKQQEFPYDKTILFVCVENAGRSQMAEGFFRKYAQRGYMTLSAGTKPSGDINPLAIEVMKEVGIDISNQISKDLTEDMMRCSTKIFNTGCMDKSFCPTLFPM